LKALRKTIATAVVGLLAVGMTLNFSGCSKESSPMGPKSEDLKTEISSLAKSGKSTLRSNAESLTTTDYTTLTDGNTSYDLIGNYPQTGSGICMYQRSQKIYKGTQFHLDGASQFYLCNGALAPPSDWKKGKDVTITMTMDKNTNGEIITSFGPHGCTFNPPARVILDWNKLGIPEGQIPNLFYIEADGSYTEQKPDQVDMKNKWFILYIDHFSRYALAHSE